MTSLTDETARRWMDEGTRLFLGALADLGDDDRRGEPDVRLA